MSEDSLEKRRKIEELKKRIEEVRRAVEQRRMEVILKSTHPSTQLQQALKEQDKFLKEDG